jgi:hypothetical protein
MISNLYDPFVWNLNLKRAFKSKFSCFSLKTPVGRNPSAQPSLPLSLFPFSHEHGPAQLSSFSFPQRSTAHAARPQTTAHSPPPPGTNSRATLHLPFHPGQLTGGTHPSAFPSSSARSLSRLIPPRVATHPAPRQRAQPPAPLFSTSP